MKNLCLLLLAAAACLFLPSNGLGVPLGQNWERVDSRSASAAADLVATGGRLIAVGEGGAIWETRDRQAWSTPRSGVLLNLNAVAAGNGVVVAVGVAGTVLRSDTAGIWTTELSGVAADLTSVTYGNGRFVAVGKSGVAVYSPDGRTWLAWPTGQTSPLNRVAWNGTAFMAGGNAGLLLKASPGGEWSVVTNPWIGYDDIGAIVGKGPGWIIGSARVYAESSLHSTDGTTWTIGGGMGFADMVAGAGKFVGTSRHGAIQSSEDGVVWSSYQTSLTGDFVAVEWTGSDFVAMTAKRQLAMSVDGKRWKARGLMQDMSAGCWDGSQYAVVGATGKILTSPDGRNWTSEMNPDTNNLRSVVFADGRFVAVGQEGVILRSLNGRDWQKVALPVGWDFYDVHWSDSAFWTVGEGGVVLTSADGLAWTVMNPGTLDAVVWDGHRYLAFSGRTVIESQDGNAWQPLAQVPWPGTVTPPESQIHQIIWTGQYYVAGGKNRWVLRSPDGAQWTRGEIAGSASLEFTSIAYSGSRFVALLASGGEVAISDDGLNWTRMSSAVIPGGTKKVIWDGARFVVVTGNTVFASTDGTTWTQIATITTGGQALSLRSIAWDGTRYLAAGVGGGYGSSGGGIIGTSTNGVTWTFLPVEPGTSYTHVSGDAGSAMALRSDGMAKRWNGSAWAEENSGLSGEPLGLIKNGASYVAFSSAGMVSISAAAGTWHPGDRRVNRETLRSIISGNGVLVAGGEGSILRSTDGRNWTLESSVGFYGPFIDPVWTGSQFLLLGGSRIYTSSDGTAWIPSAGLDTSGPSSLALFGGKTVVAGNGIWIEDGTVYRRVHPNLGTTVAALISNGSELLAIGYNETMASSDGEHWMTIDPEPFSVASLTDVVHTPAGFFACGELSQIQHSSDGKTWSQRTVNGMPKLNAMIYTNIGLVGVGKGFAFSPDGETWTCKSESPEYLGVASGNGRIVASAFNHAAVSTDGINWQVVTHTLKASKVVWSGTEFVMSLDERGMAVSTDGLTWQVVVIPSNVTGLCASSDVFIAGNPHADLYRSVDGLRWSMVLDSTVSTGKMRVVRTGNLFFSFGNYIHSSTDGTTWTQRMRNHNDIVWTGERYVGVGNSGATGVSTNGTTWTSVSSGTTSELNRVIWTGSKLIAVGANGILLTSTDGLAWTVSNIGSTTTLVDMAIYNGKWVAIASDGTLAYESGGPAVPAGFLANALFVDGNSLLAAGRAGRIASLSNGTWSEVASPTYWDLHTLCSTPLGLQACGSWNVILRRSPAGEWNLITGGASGVPAGMPNEGFTDLGMAAGQLFALGSSGLIASSTSGRVWYPDMRANNRVLRGAVDVSGQLFAVGDSGVIVRAAGGVVTPLTSSTNLGLRAVAHGNNRLVAVGVNGVIVLSKTEPYDDLQDTDRDGLSDFLEWAMGSNPEEATPPQVALSQEDDQMAFTYPRSVAAVEANAVFTVEWSDDLIVWQSAGVGEVSAIVVTPGVQQVRVTVPEGTTGARFVRLGVGEPR
ncbi:hypothetical protein [Luteolibacter sp. Populi]|uniref:hypothetical protein n=1 Tax=Luteolibacter sp. Populi TaxID=3230487 RepID=UPI003466D077